MSHIRIAQPIVLLHGGGSALACGLDAQMHSAEQHGLIAGDTRMLSTYRFAISGHPWRLLSRFREGHGTARWEFDNPDIHDPLGDVPHGYLLLSLRRRVDGIMHDDFRIHGYLMKPVRVRLTLQFDADFADIFELRTCELQPRLTIRRDADACGGVLTYERADFRRALRLRCRANTGVPTTVGAMLAYEIDVEPGREWVCCVEAVPEIGRSVVAVSTEPHGPEALPVEPNSMMLRTSPILEGPFETGRVDLRSLAITDGYATYVAAGIPWFLTLFGRDTLMVGLMASLEGLWMARGALEAVGSRQAVARDDWRDMEPGKLPHEIRRGELSHFDRVPHKAYYGTHDTPALYGLALWHAWRWSGDRALLDRHLETARRALQWCETLGDRDGDGLLEYETRSRDGYYNQSWKDAGDAILDEQGALAALPLATVEMQGYWYAMYLAMAEMYDEVGDPEEALRCRHAAEALRLRVEERFWLEAEGYYALALDGHKRPIATIASNAGHLLWCGLPAPARAARVADRLLKPDLFSGWGLRTLSSDHPGYNPLSYQRGSVWPHDTMLAVAGLMRYGRREEAARLLHAILDAADVFDNDRLPELFCGLDRAHGLPVPHAEANVPQAWAAAAPMLAVQVLIGLVPDAPHHRCAIDPWLPPWLPRLELRGLAIGDGTLDLCVTRRGDRTVIDEAVGKDLDVIRGPVPAPLWGTPPGAGDDQ